MEPDISAGVDSATLLYLIISLLLLLFLSILLLIWYSGAFDPIDIKTIKSPFGEMEIAYKFLREAPREDYSLLFAETHALAPDLRCIAVNYDEGETQEGKKSIVGVILDDREEEKKKFLSKGYQTAKFPAVEHIVCVEFPSTTFLSVFIATHRVVKEFRGYILEKELAAYPTLEIYGGSTITYLAPLSNQSQFTVPEAETDSEEEEDMTSLDRTADEGTELSSRELEFPDTLSSADSLIPSRIEELPSNEVVPDSLEEDKEKGNGSEASTESFEELQLDT